MLCRMCNKKGQATTELAIMGTIIIMLLAYLLQQGYLYNSRQALEMYTFRKALELSQAKQQGISLTVIRDIITPSFFTGLNRQRLMASSVIDHNPWLLYVPDVAQDTPSIQLLQINEAMLNRELFFKVPPTKLLLSTKDNQEKAEWQWSNSAIYEIDPQTKPVKVTQRTSHYNYVSSVSEDSKTNTVSKYLETKDSIPAAITFENAEKIKENYRRDDWERKIISIKIDEKTIPKDINLILEEIVRRQKYAQTAR